MSKFLVKIIVPVYKNTFSPYEMFSLNQCCDVLKDYPLIFVKPESLDSKKLLQKFPEFQLEAFPDHYFKGIRGYNHLMLSPDFYERFSDTEYILIHQTDAFIFRDDLKYWCGLSYDYIGAPWIQKKRNPISLFFHKRELKKKSYKKDILFKVGNGGFSLRKVAPFIEITRKEKNLITTYLFPKIKIDYIPEDVFWALEPQRLGYEFKIPNYKKALEFAIDQYPADCFGITGKLPMGCHAWNHHGDERKFWKKHITVHA
jgi:hypothetical protein